MKEEERVKLRKKLTLKVKKWADKLREEKYYEETKIDLYGFLDQDGREFFKAGLRLEILASLLLGEGSLLVATGADPSKGKRLIELSYRYQHLSLRITIAQQISLGRLYEFYGGDVNDLYQLLLLSVVFGDPSSVKEISKHLKGFELNGAYNVLSLDSPFCLFTRSLADLYLGSSLSELKYQDPYSRVFLNWENEPKLAEAINDVLDYHLASAVHQRGYATAHDTQCPEVPFNPAFDREYIMLLPIEYLAICATRNCQGLSTPTVDHPLADSSFLQLLNADGTGVSDDEVLERVTRRMKERGILSPFTANVR